MKPETVPLGEACIVVMGQSPPGTSYNTSGDGLPFFQGKTDFGAIYPKTRVFCNQPSRIAEEGDILMSVRAPVGPTNLAKEKCCIGRGLAALRTDARLDTSFLLYFLRHHEPRLASQGQGSTFDAINRDDLEEIEIPLPGLPEQRRIAEQLEQADRLRRTRRYALELTDAFLPAAFLELFGDPVANPRGWERARVCEIGDVETGNTPPRETADYYGSAIEWIKSDNISLAQMHPSNATEGLSEKGIEVGRIVETGSLLLTCIAGSETSIGNVVLTDRRVAFNQQINAVTPHRDVDPQFLYGLFLAAKPMIQRNTTLAMKRMITKGKLENLVLIKPPLTVQQKFAALVEQVERLRAAQREALRQAEHLFKTLLHSTFSERA
ncbi:MAG: restriction endonuclease subunit S [Candidatus Acidiferrum sp.]